MQYILNGGLTPAQPPETGTPYVEVLTRNDFDARYGDLVQDSLLTRSMEHEQHCKADLFRRYVLGTLHVPDKKELRRRAWDCGFYLDQERLLLVSDGPELETLLHAIDGRQITALRTPAQALFELLEAMIRGDEDFTDAFEDELERREADMNDSVHAVPPDLDRYLMRARRELMVLGRFYKQLSQVGDRLAECTNGLIERESLDLFRLFSHRAERLHADAAALREYALQILDLYQSRINVRQNRIIQILTILSAIFMPLTLIAGWYGMNFSGMPELRMPHGYLAVSLLAAAVVAAELIVFKRKKWM